MTRFPAEWEKQSAVQLTLPHIETDWAETLEIVLPCFEKIAKTIARFQPVLLVCQNSAQIRGRFSGGETGNIFFAECDSNDTWARDHAAITVFENRKPVLLDFVFNGWGLKFPANKDNLITSTLFKKKIFNGKLRPGALVLEGGGIESNGAGILLTTSECLLSPNRNPHLSKKQLENRLKKLFGLQKILWLNHGYLAGDDTDSHIDTLARFCNENTITYVRCENPADEHFPELQKMETELQNFRNLEGKSFNLVPLPFPDACFDENGNRLPATYANFLIINGAVLVPTYGVPQDEAALHIIKGVFPGREIVGIDCRPLILQHGSLHCVTMQFPEGVFKN